MDTIGGTRITVLISVEVPVSRLGSLIAIIGWFLKPGRDGQVMGWDRECNLLD